MEILEDGTRKWGWEWGRQKCRHQRLGGREILNYRLKILVMRAYGF